MEGDVRYAQYNIIGTSRAYRHSTTYGQAEEDPYHCKDLQKQMSQNLKNKLETS